VRGQKFAWWPLSAAQCRRCESVGGPSHNPGLRWQTRWIARARPGSGSLSTTAAINRRCASVRVPKVRPHSPGDDGLQARRGRLWSRSRLKRTAGDQRHLISGQREGTCQNSGELVIAAPMSRPRRASFRLVRLRRCDGRHNCVLYRRRKQEMRERAAPNRCNHAARRAGALQAAPEVLRRLSAFLRVRVGPARERLVGMADRNRRPRDLGEE
jgi:hypothetical protein